MDNLLIDALQKSRIGFVANATLADTLFMKFSIQSRISIVVTAVFNVLASAAVVATILYDSWRLANLRVPRRRFEFLTRIPTVHVFSNALAIATAIQGSVFIAVQAMGLQDVLTNNCRTFSQITWTATWVIGYTILIFSSESACRSIHRAYSASPCRSYTLVNWIILIVFLLLTWIPSFVRPTTMNICAADLTQWMAPWADIGTALTSLLIVFYILNATTLSFRLRRPDKLSFEQRIAVRNQIYYLLVNAAIFVFTLPFWIEVTTSHSTAVAAMMMSIVINLFGIVNGVLFLLLRASGENVITRSENPIWFMKPPRRYTDSTELAVAQQMFMPVDLERNNSAVKQAEFSNNRFSQHLKPVPRNHGERLKPLSEASFPDGRSSMERLTEDVAQNKKIYSLTSTSRDSLTVSSSVVSMTDIDDFVFLPPQPYFSHRRRSSDISAATVQIGLCLSSIPVPLSAHVRSSRVPQTLEKLAPTRFSPANNLSSNIFRGSRGLPPSIHPLKNNPPSPNNPNLLDANTSAESSNTTTQPPPPVLEPHLDRAYSVDLDRPSTENSPFADPTSPEALPRRGRKNSAWPLPESFSMLPDKTYSQVPWI
ncbi:hypothetical protein PRK78_007416 [Emydomyces testavorans]|uniref:Uncharacterized protein n=1 Tax=Emydomyces testavorans TaxID=2070801 RepID=A0AAF0IMN1_9EURO|nr:hypothetical protein PRK78_007416 [Emydomyces testavorans]